LPVAVRLQAGRYKYNETNTGASLLAKNTCKTPTNLLRCTRKRAVMKLLQNWGGLEAKYA
jgi:hypothetical protein